MKTKTPPKQDATTITLADIAREIGGDMDPEKARSKARKNLTEIVALQVSKTSKYIFPVKNKAKVVKLITG